MRRISTSLAVGMIWSTPLLFCGTAWAQNVQVAPRPAGEAVAAAPQAGDAMPRDTAAAASSDDIVVTARRRAERLQDVPIAVQAFSAENLQTRGVAQVADLQNVTPTLRIAPAAGRSSNPSYEIRGISATESLITQDPAVGFYVNEVYVARPVGSNQQLLDLENVQVLLGPQGTLFGRNSTAGAILFTTKRPVLNTVEGEVNGTVGNFGRYEGAAVLNVPLGDTVAVRLAGQRVSSDGYGRDITNGIRLANDDIWSGRASVLFRPSEQFENLLVASYYDAKNNGNINTITAARACNNANPFAGTPPLGCLYSPAAIALLTRLGRPNGGNIFDQIAAQQQRSPYDVALTPGLIQFENDRSFGLSNTTIFSLTDAIKIKNIFGYNDMRADSLTDYDGAPAAILAPAVRNSAHQLSNELQVQGDTGRLNWVVGGLYFRERGNDFQRNFQLTAFNPNNPTLNNTTGTNTSYAVFAQGTFRITPRLGLTAGARYTWDRRQAELRPRVGPSAACGLDITVFPTCVAAVRKNFSEPTYTISADYKITDDTLLYVAHRRGYRAGGFNPRATTVFQLQPFNPERVKDVEIGYKGTYRIGDIGIRTSIAGYQTWYDDIQRVVGVDPDGAGPAPIQTLVQNAASAKIKGFEANLGITPVRGFDISGFVGYVDANHQRYAVGATVLTNVPFPVASTTAGGVLALTPVDRQDIGTVTFTSSLAYRSSAFSALALPLLDPEGRIPPQALLNLSLDWNRIMGSGISAQLFARNALNEDNILGSFSVQSALGLSSRTYGEPRTYGLRLKYAF